MIKDQKPDIVHVFNSFMMISPSIFHVCKKLGIPTIQRLANYRLFCPKATLFRNNQICELCVKKKYAWPAIKHGCYQDSRLKSANVFGMLAFHRMIGTWHSTIDCYLAISEFVREKYIEAGFPAEKIRVKPNYLRDDPGKSDVDDHYALYVGRLSPEKGILSVVKAWKGIQQMPLKIIGEGPQKREIMEYIASHNLSNVHLLGELPHEEVMTLMKRMSFLMFSSIWYEPFGRVIIEAFAHGKTVIAPDTEIGRSVIRHEDNGLVYQVRNIKSLRSTVVRLSQDADYRRKLAHNARIDYVEKYAADTNYHILMKIYDEVIENYC